MKKVLFAVLLFTATVAKAQKQFSSVTFFNLDAVPVGEARHSGLMCERMGDNKKFIFVEGETEIVPVTMFEILLDIPKTHCLHVIQSYEDGGYQIIKTWNSNDEYKFFTAYPNKQIHLVYTAKN